VKKLFVFVSVSLYGGHFPIAPAGWFPNASIDSVFPDGGRSIVCNELLKEFVMNRFCTSCHCLMIADRFATRQNAVWCHLKCPCCRQEQCFETLPGTTISGSQHLQATVQTVFTVLVTGQHYQQYSKACIMQAMKPIPETTFFNIQKEYSNSIEAACDADNYLILKQVVQHLPAGSILPVSWDFQWSQRSQAYAGAGHLVLSKHCVPSALGSKSLVLWSKTLIKKHSITLKGGRKVEVMFLFISFVFVLPSLCFSFPQLLKM
jgi:hypothetical protein